MNEIEPTAAAWMDAVRVECPILPPISVATVALQRALLEIKINELKLADYKQELADFRQKVSDAVETALQNYPPTFLREHLHQFIIPAAKPDPLVEVLLEMDLSSDLEEGQHDAKWLRIKLDALGYEIREKNDD
jgi:hypothetical protein